MRSNFFLGNRLFVWFCMVALGPEAYASTTTAVQMRVIAQSGETAPSGLGFNLSLIKLDTLIDATINDRGDVVYRALTDVSFQNRRRVGLWIDPIQNGEPDRFLGILTGIRAPGAPMGRQFSGASLPILDDSGNSLATQFLEDDSRSFTGVWLATDQAVLPILMPGQQAPGLDPGELAFVARAPAFTGGGIGLIEAFTDQGRDALWRFSDGGLELLAINRSPIAGLPGFEFTGVGLSGKINDLGTAVIKGQITDGVLNEGALLRVAPDGTRDLLVRSGMAVPGAPLGSTFAGLGSFRINNAGAISISTQFRMPSGSLGSGIWVQESGESLQPVVLSGMMTPDGDTVVQSFTGNYNLNESGYLGFRASLDRGGGDIVVSAWLGSLEGTELLATVGEQAPGFAPGVVFHQVGTPQLNDRGTVFLTSRLRGPGFPDQALFYRTVGGQLTPLVWDGQVLELATGDTRRVLDFDSPIAEAGRATGINNRNEAAIAINFDDGSSAVVVFAIVPEPTTALLVVVATAGLLAVRRRLKPPAPAYLPNA